MAKVPRNPDGPDRDPDIADPTYIGTVNAERRAKRGDGDGGGGSGDGPSSRLAERVARLEVLAETSREDLKEIKSDLKAIIAKLGTFPAKSDLESWKWQWVIACVAIVAFIVSSIIGGLAWLADK